MYYNLLHMSDECELTSEQNVSSFSCSIHKVILGLSQEKTLNGPKGGDLYYICILVTSYT